MLMDEKFECGVPYVDYQFLRKGNEFWEVHTPANPLSPLELHHWKVLDEVRFGWHDYIEVKVHEVDKNYDYWLKVELVAMGHILKTHYFETEEDARKYMKWYSENIGR